MSRVTSWVCTIDAKVNAVIGFVNEPISKSVSPSASGARGAEIMLI